MACAGGASVVARGAARITCSAGLGGARRPGCNQFWQNAFLAAPPLPQHSFPRDDDAHIGGACRCCCSRQETWYVSPTCHIAHRPPPLPGTQREGGRVADRKPFTRSLLSRGAKSSLIALCRSCVIPAVSIPRSPPLDWLGQAGHCVCFRPASVHPPPRSSLIAVQNFEALLPFSTWMLTLIHRFRCDSTHLNVPRSTSRLPLSLRILLTPTALSLLITAHSQCQNLIRQTLVDHMAAHQALQMTHNSVRAAAFAQPGTRESRTTIPALLSLTGPIYAYILFHRLSNQPY